MFKFEPGSYKTPAGFLPALACYKIGKNNEETLDYILTNTEAIEQFEVMAENNAENYLNKAFNKAKKAKDEQKIGLSLKSDGFQKMENPKFATD
jgi:hypothetical protein